MELQKPKHIVSLATAGMLVNVDVHVWTATKQDRDISDEVTTAKKADKDSVRVVKNILANDPDHKRIINYRQTVYNWLQKRAYDWAGSQRYLPQVVVPKFMGEYKTHDAMFNKLVDIFIIKYPTIISNMAFGMGDMFDRNEYPPVDSLKNKFSIQLFTADVPVGDFRCQIAQDLADDMFTNYTKQTTKIIDNILVKQAEQFMNVMTSISYCCGVDETTDKHGLPVTKKRKIYEQTIAKALELCDTFKSFNLTNNEQLEEARSSLEKVLRGVSVDSLKEVDHKRKQVKDDIDDILGKFRPTLNQEEV